MRFWDVYSRNKTNYYIKDKTINVNEIKDALEKKLEEKYENYLGNSVNLAYL